MTKKPLLGKEKIYLKDHLPLSMPISIMIDPSNLCNFRCNFCPTSDNELLKKFSRPKGMMDFSLFQKIIDDIVKLKLKTQINPKSLLLYKDGEPLLNKNIDKMVSYVKQKKVIDYIGITTNASLLNMDMTNKLLNSGLDTLRVSIQSLSQVNFQKITKTKFDTQKIKKNISYFYSQKKELNKKTELIISYVDSENLDESKKKNFVDEYSLISDRVDIKPINGWTRSDENDWRVGNERKKVGEPIVCADPFSRLSINFDGSVSICCVDWSHGTVVGNLKSESIEEVWNGKKLNEFRILHLKGQRSKIGPCSKCDYIKDKDEYDFIDEKADELLKIFEKRI
jgi:radical SAM protein with 4Fe4S-binding SPASM domain